MGKEKKEKKPHPLSEPTVTDQREVMERGVNSTVCRGFVGGLLESLQEDLLVIG